MNTNTFIKRSVQVAKPLVRNVLLERGEAFVYCEPENLVVSRSGDTCVVGLTDQWYLNYGEQEWKAKGLKCLENMHLYSEETRNNFLKGFDNVFFGIMC